MNRYTITQAIEDVAENLRGHYDQSATTIRCSLNDCLDHAGKSGFKVRHDYDQERAVKRVKSLLGLL